MTSENSDERVVRSGVHDNYWWLTCTGDVYIGTVLHLCPEIVLDRYLAVTSLDSGVRRLTEEERHAGWTTRAEIAYSPLITSFNQLQYQQDGLDSPGYDEWYIFETAREMPGEVFQGNIFEFQPSPAHLLIFVNTFAFVLHDTEPHNIADILELFWKQMEQLNPESYIADGRECLTLVSKNKLLVDTVYERLSMCAHTL